jgi:methyl-accepting chemotaxis protein
MLERWRTLRGLPAIGGGQISTKLIAAALLLALLPVLFVSVGADRALTSSLTRSQEQALLSKANDNTTALVNLINKNRIIVEILARNDLLALYAVGSELERSAIRANTELQLRNILQQDPSFEAVGMIGLDGVYNVDQVAQGQNFKQRVGTNVSARDYFQIAKGGKSAVSNIEVSPVTGKPVIVFTAPVFYQNQVVGVVSMRTATAPVQELLSNQPGGESVMIMDDEGIILLHGTDNSRYQYRAVAPLTAQQQETFAKSKRFGADVTEVQQLGAPGFDRAFASGRQVDRFTYTLDGREYHASMTPVEGVPWRIVASVPDAVFTAPVNDQRRLISILALVAIGVALAVGIAFARTLTRRIRALETAASAVAAGDYDVRLPVTNDDELSRVAQTVNLMVERLTENTRQQEEQNAILQGQIVRLLDEVSSVAEGDLTVEAEVSADALGAVADSFNYMIAELRQIIGRVNSATQQVGASTDEILATTDVLNRSAQQQAARIADTSTAVEEMAVSIQQVSENAALSAQVAREARATAAAGADAVAATVAGMERIRDRVQETARKIEQLGASSQEIGAIVSLIREVADQTELLALNAAIEAALAGEQGKGFAVVAEEVRRLAERVAVASAQIDTLVQGVQGETREAIAAMAEGTREVTAGAELADEAGHALARIDATATQLAELIEAISLAAEQQARASAGIARAMGEVSALTTGTTAGTQQAAASVAALAALATDLRASVAAFRLEAGRPQENGAGAGWSAPVRQEPARRADAPALVAAGHGAAAD